MSAAAESVTNRILQMPFPEYAERFLKIRTKTQGIQPFKLNVGQHFLHRKAELQMLKRGFVRIDLLKARQWGGSTYIQGRCYSKIARGAQGMRAFILTHHADASDNLFGMTHRFHNNLDARIRPSAPPPSRKRIVFPHLDSSYAVATAGTHAVGRSDTIQFFHGSEVAFWPNAEDHLSGALQAVPAQGIDTEVFRESTGNGMGNAWHKAFSLSLSRMSDYEAIFVPWFWFDEYAAPITTLEMSDDDEDYATMWGLTEQQMQFRHNKIVEFGGGDAGRAKFLQEYPCTPEDAFSTNVAGGYIEAKFVILARRRVEQFARTFGPKILGLDPAWTGDDRFVAFIRHGRRARRVGRWRKLRLQQSVSRVASIIEKERPDVICVDVGGLGGPIFDAISEVVDQRIMMVPVLGGETADDRDRWRNKRCEVHGRMREWFEDGITPSLKDEVITDPDEMDSGLDEIQADITCILTDWDAKGRAQVETKKRVLSHSPSPDNDEALAVTFALPFGPDWKSQQTDYTERQIERGNPNWRAI